ncbi:FMN-linked oxidoreductase [Neolentinus lepideus HHB14362 ss-1]|uniref:FMN-linked oxidoreductase n=1 Tax=Neolentinus lepideus HHB14362 ss-1 TaxID=1314782 RepID=A0A165T0M2_9AGAM|nr:FMN-linked oxidoreductase [Neolentinus lepideus HHB14362 ss-1]
MTLSSFTRRTSRRNSPDDQGHNLTNLLPLPKDEISLLRHAGQSRKWPIKSQTQQCLDITQFKNLFQPIRIGAEELSHRIVLAPLTRLRANKAHVHGDLAVEYYKQRSSTPGTLLIAEGTIIAAKAGGWDHTPASEVVDAVQAQGCFIYLQFAALGRSGNPELLERDGISKDNFVGASAISAHPGGAVPRPMTHTDISEYLKVYATAASNAVLKDDFDGVEIHKGSGTLSGQFLQDVSNQRTDKYGGSIENRVRFPLQMVRAVADAIGEDRTAVHILPWDTSSGIRMQDPRPTFAHFVSKLCALHPGLAYLHVVEPRVSNLLTAEEGPLSESDSNDFIRNIWAPLPLISAGGYSRESATEATEKCDYLIAFGRTYIANPDLPMRFMKNTPLTPYDTSTFYAPDLGCTWIY